MPTIGAGMILGAVATIGLLVSLFMAWRTGDVTPSGIPFAFLFDDGTTSSDPSLLIALIPALLLLAAGTALPQASAARAVGSVIALAVVILFAVQLNNQLDQFPGSSVGDTLETGFYVAGFAGLVGIVSALVPSGWMRRRTTRVERTAEPSDLPRV
jgi:hypothetical protein